MPAETVPPIGPNLLMHFFTHPEEAASHSVLLQCIPKRKTAELEPCQIKGWSTGWGLDLTTGVNELKLFGLGFVGSLASAVFGIAWACIRNDIQSGFTVAGLILTYFVFTVASFKSARFVIVLDVPVEYCADTALQNDSLPLLVPYSRLYM
jgi:hypothetical protein